MTVCPRCGDFVDHLDELHGWCQECVHGPAPELVEADLDKVIVPCPKCGAGRLVTRHYATKKRCRDAICRGCSDEKNLELGRTMRWAA